MAQNPVLDELRQFVRERDWGKFHTPSNLAKSISIEAGELLECFQWEGENLESAKEELADVLTYCLLLADVMGVDPEDIVAAKLVKTREKYPIDKSFGRSVKYDRL